MAEKRVYVLSHRCMFHDGIETLLAQEEGIEIIKHDKNAGESLDNINNLCCSISIGTVRNYAMP